MVKIMSGTRQRLQREASLGRGSHVALALLAALFAGMSAVPVAEAQIYRWTDADGKLHFGDRPPADAEPVAGHAPPAQARDTSGSDSALCTAEREQLMAYQTADRITESSVLGEERALTDEQREQLIAMQLGVVEAACD